MTQGRSLVHSMSPPLMHECPGLLALINGQHVQYSLSLSAQSSEALHGIRAAAVPTVSQILSQIQLPTHTYQHRGGVEA
jgi:hypothetical protein